MLKLAVFSLGLKLPGKTIFTLTLFFIVQHMCELSSAVIKPSQTVALSQDYLCDVENVVFDP